MSGYYEAYPSDRDVPGFAAPWERDEEPEDEQPAETGEPIEDSAVEDEPLPF